MSASVTTGVIKLASGTLEAAGGEGSAWATDGCAGAGGAVFFAPGRFPGVDAAGSQGGFLCLRLEAAARGMVAEGTEMDAAAVGLLDASGTAASAVAPTLGTSDPWAWT